MVKWFYFSIWFVIIEECLLEEMSVTISNCDEISKSPANTSPSKQLYTFPKTARFNSRKFIMYLFSYSGVIGTMTFHPPSATVEPPPLDSDTSTISPMSNYSSIQRT